MNKELNLSYFPYGKCHKCGKAIKIPGLDAYFCNGNCGWVKTKKVKPQQANVTKKH